MLDSIRINPTQLAKRRFCLYQPLLPSLLALSLSGVLLSDPVFALPRPPSGSPPSGSPGGSLAYPQPPSTPPPNHTRPGGSLGDPQPPSTPPPNHTRPGGSLGDSESCSMTAKPLVALIPVENPVLTTSAHPTLLVYVPYGSSQVSFGEFSVLVGIQETTRLYHARFTLPTKPGIVSIRLPDSAALQEDVFYHWYFKLYCQGNSSAKADLGVDGWIKRVSPLPTLPNAATPVIWYDALSDLADRLQTSPQNKDLTDRWRTLLSSIQAADVASEPLVGSVTLLEN